MSYQRLYPQRINWEDEPSLATPINQVNLNKMDSALYGIDGRVVELDENKVGKSDTFNTSRNGVVPKPTQADITNEKVLRADGSWVEQSGGGGGGGGHTIVNNAGTSLTQRGKLKTVGGLNATDDGVNNTTEITDVVEEVPWATWQSYPNEEAALQAHPNCVVTGAPDCDGDIEIEFLKLAWKNPNPASAFASQTITLDTDGDWDFIDITPQVTSGSTRKTNTLRLQKNDYGWLEHGRPSSSGVVECQRMCQVLSDTQVTFSDALYSQNAQASTTDNTFLIPINIYVGKFKPTAKIKAIAHDVSTSASKCMIDENTSVADVLINQPTDTSVSRIISNVVNGILIVDYSGIVVASNPNTWITCGILPVGYRPSQNSYSVALNSQGQMALIYVNTAGELQIRVTQVNSQYGYYGQIVVKI